MELLDRRIGLRGSRANLRHCVVELLRQLTSLDIRHDAVHSDRRLLQVRGCRLYVRHGFTYLTRQLLILKEHSGRPADLLKSNQQVIRVPYGSIYAIKGNVELSSDLLNG